jgi:hypothetical protein
VCAVIWTGTKRCAIQTVYGHSGFATKAIYDEESRAKLLQQTEQVRAMHNWGCEDKAVTCQVLCGDFNLVDDEDLDVRQGARGKRHDEGMLAVALDNLGYDDAVRLRVGQEKRMHTFERNAKNGQVRSYLDRILVIGAEVTRAGILLPNKFRGLISCDHALVVADLDVTPLGKPNPEGELTKPLAKLGGKFIKLGREMKKEGTTTLAQHIQSGIDRDERGLKGVGRSAEIVRSQLTDLSSKYSPHTPKDREAQMKEVATILHGFMQGIYVPIISWTMKKRHQATATDRPNGKDRSMNAELYAATMDLEGATRQEIREGTEEGELSEMLPIQELANRLHDAWTNFRNWSQPGWPDVQMEDTEWPDIDGEIMLELQDHNYRRHQSLNATRGRRHHPQMQTVDELCEEENTRACGFPASKQSGR